MNIYKIIRLDPPNFDEYTAAVVVAKSPQDAKKIHPGGRLDESTRDWTTPELIDVLYLGKAGAQLERGVYLEDFRRG